MTKKCNKCGFSLSLDHFGKHDIMPDGLRSVCKKCNNNSRKKYYEENKTDELTRNKHYYSINKKEIIGRNRLVKHLHPSNSFEYRLSYRIKNKESLEKYNRENLPRKLALNAERRALRNSGTLPDKRYRNEISQIYENCPSGNHVDHIIPLKAKNKMGEWIACGLHVPWNLQYLLATENLRKNSKIGFL